MAEVLAGFIVGFALSILAAPAGALLLVSSNDRTGFAQRIAPPGTNLVALAMVVHFGAMLVFTAIGIVLGMALAGIEDRRPAGGFGSPTAAYTLLVVALTAVMVIPTLILPLRRYALAGGLAFAVLFGWAVPWLATRA